MLNTYKAGEIIYTPDYIEEVVPFYIEEIPV